jgi:hypothetical protein
MYRARDEDIKVGAIETMAADHVFLVINSRFL